MEGSLTGDRWVQIRGSLCQQWRGQPAATSWSTIHTTRCPCLVSEGEKPSRLCCLGSLEGKKYKPIENQTWLVLMFIEKKFQQKNLSVKMILSPVHIKYLASVVLTWLVYSLLHVVVPTWLKGKDNWGTTSQLYRSKRLTDMLSSLCRQTQEK